MRSGKPIVTLFFLIGHILEFPALYLQQCPFLSLQHPPGMEDLPQRKKEARWDSGPKDTKARLGADAAKVSGIWQTDGSQHTSSQRVTAGDSREPAVRAPPLEGQRSLCVFYLF